jgi:nitrate reductase NapE component
VQIIYGIVEAFHLDIVLAFILHIAQRDRVQHSHLSMQYFAICLVSILSIGLVAMYLFMIYTVQRLTKEYNDLKVVEVSEMKKERYKFLLEDKAVKGNVFQRHYSLIGMLKDNYNCFVLYCFYNQPLVLVLMLLGLQLPMTVLVYFYPPFKVQWVNRMSLITQVLYCLLDVVFIWNIAGGKSISTEDRYYYIGFSLIGLVIFIILTNMGFGMYYSMKESLKECKKKREKDQLKKQQIARENQVQAASPQAFFESSRDESAMIGLSKPDPKTVNSKPKSRLIRNAILNKGDTTVNKSSAGQAMVSNEPAEQNQLFQHSKNRNTTMTTGKSSTNKTQDVKSAQLQKISNSTNFSNQDSLVEDVRSDASSVERKQNHPSSSQSGNNGGSSIFRGSGNGNNPQTAIPRKVGRKGYIGEFRLRK